MRAARYVVRRQRADGSWAYGSDNHQSWSDTFHTAFILTSLSRIIAALRSEPGAVATGLLDELDNSLCCGYEFWRERFFLDNGWPKYYPDRLYPADAHSAGSAIVTLVELRGRVSGTMILAENVAQWAVENLHDQRGFFYHQRRRFHTVRIPYIRWSEAWMAYGLARLLEVTH
jgi:rhamnogalacturonyl hydrolase YesR